MISAGEALRAATQAITELQNRLDGLTVSLELLQKKVEAIDARLPPAPATHD